MGVYYLLTVALLFSLCGSCVKLISPFFSAEYISLGRFVFGIMFLLILKLIKRQPFQKDLWQRVRKCGKWLAFGGVCKAFAYLTENYALTHGVSYGNILTQPAQIVFLSIISAVLFRQKLTGKKIAFFVPCVLGVLLVSWNGRSLNDYLTGNFGLMLLFLLSGTLAGCHVLAQKKMAGAMDIIESNLVMFSISAVITGIATLPATFSGALDGVQPTLVCILAMMGTGFVTGIGFYLNAKAIPLVPFYMVPILQSAMAIFSICWAALFFHEAITVYVITGTLMFILGIIGLQLADVKKPEAA